MTPSSQAEPSHEPDLYSKTTWNQDYQLFEYILEISSMLLKMLYSRIIWTGIQIFIKIASLSKIRIDAHLSSPKGLQTSCVLYCDKIQVLGQKLRKSQAHQKVTENTFICCILKCIVYVYMSTFVPICIITTFPDKCSGTCMDKCSSSWIRHEDKCYKLSKSMKSWSDAEKSCRCLLAVQPLPS